VGPDGVDDGGKLAPIGQIEPGTDLFLEAFDMPDADVNSTAESGDPAEDPEAEAAAAGN